MSWGKYSIQNWGEHTCSEGQPVLTLEECINATREFHKLCPATQLSLALPLEETWDGPQGCHLQRMVAADGSVTGEGNFQFNSNFDADGGAPHHGPICIVDRDSPGYPGYVTDDVRASCPRYLLG